MVHWIDVGYLDKIKYIKNRTFAKKSRRKYSTLCLKCGFECWVATIPYTVVLALYRRQHVDLLGNGYEFFQPRASGIHHSRGGPHIPSPDTQHSNTHFRESAQYFRLLFSNVWFLIYFILSKKPPLHERPCFIHNYDNTTVIFSLQVDLHFQ